MPREPLREPWTSVVARAAELMQELVQLKESWKENRFAASQSLEDMLSVAGMDYLREVLGEGAGVGCGPFLAVAALGCDERDVLQVPFVFAFSKQGAGRQ